MWLLLYAACTTPEAPGGAADSAPACTGCDTASTTPNLDPGHPTAPLDLLVLSVDTLRADQVVPDIMPFLAAKEAEGVTFTHHFAAGAWTYEGMGAAMTGVYVPDLGPGAEGDPSQGFPSLPDRATTLAEVLAGVGRATFYDSGNSLAGAGVGLDQGFATYTEETDAATQLADTRAWIGGQAGRWFAQVHLMTPHTPYTEFAESCAAEVAAAAPACPYDLADERATLLMNAELGGWDDATWDGCRTAVRVAHSCEATQLDLALATFWSELAADGVLDHTMVVFYNDHAEGWGDPSFNHLQHLRLSNTSGIAWMWWPGITPATIPYATSQVDMVPTVLSVLDIPAVPTDGAVAWQAGTERYLYAFLCFNGSLVDAAIAGDGTGHVLRDHLTDTVAYFRPLDDPDETTDLAADGIGAIPADLLEAVEARGQTTRGYCGVTE